MPSSMKIIGRTSSITNAFVNSIIPAIYPADDEILEALSILGMSPEDVECAYCGDSSTEWDHLRAIVQNKQPTGQITEIGNLVPACGKCNQSKGNKNWRAWMLSDAPLSPKTKGVSDLDDRIGRLEEYEMWRPLLPVDFLSVLSEEDWNQHWSNHQEILELMKKSQELADILKKRVENREAI
jgi:hypothetical protein